MKIEPYLFFDGRCEEALAFYKSAIGAETTMLMRYNQSPDPTPPGMLPPGSENKVMHASMKIGDATVMCSDGGCSGKKSIDETSPLVGFFVAAQDPAAIRELGEGLAQRPVQVRDETYGCLAQSLGLDWSSPGRVDAGIVHVLRLSQSDGHCHLPRELLTLRATELLGVPADAVAGGIDRQIGRRALLAQGDNL